MDSPLNLAHRQQRKADSFLNAKKYDESIACHQKAADLLQEALLETSSPKATESLKLQLDHHIRQQMVVKHQQHVHEMRQKAKAAAAANHTKASNVAAVIGMESPRSVKIGIETAIFRTMAENDSLLQVLLCRPPNNLEKAPENGDSNSTQADISQSGIKMPKDDKMIIEELRINNIELRKLVKQLLLEVEQATKHCENLQQQNEQLQRYIEELQRANRMKRLAVQLWENDSSSPYVISPMGDVTPNDSSHELPALAPLDLPKFDFSVWKSETTMEP